MIRHILLLSIFVLTAALQPQALIFAEQDLSQNFEEAKMEAQETLDKELNELKKYRIIFVPGFLSNIVIQFGQGWPFKRIHLGEYFDEQIRYFQEQEFDVSRVEVESEETPAYNAELIKKEIDKDERSVIIIGHSKGNLDTLEYLIKNPDDRKKVAGWISIQAPFWGSPIADIMTAEKCTHRFAGWLLEKMGGTEKSLQSLTQEERQMYFLRNGLETIKILDEIPSLSYASWTEHSRWKMSSPLALTRNIIKKLSKERNDGLVTLSSARLPGLDYIIEEQVDHAETVMELPFRRYDRVKSTTALCSLLLTKIGKS